MQKIIDVPDFDYTKRYSRKERVSSLVSLQKMLCADLNASPNKIVTAKSGKFKWIYIWSPTEILIFKHKAYYASTPIGEYELLLEFIKGVLGQEGVKNLQC